MKIVAVTPTYNEAENLPELLRRLFALPLDTLHVLVVDDNSPDGTGRLAEQMTKEKPYAQRLEVIHRTGKLGLGTAYIHGFRHALATGADFIIQMDADLSHPPEYIPTFLNYMDQYDVVVGSRYIKGGSVDQAWGIGRKLTSSGGNLYARWITGLKIKDATSGFRCFRRQVLESIDLGNIHSRGFIFQVEMAYACERRGFRILETPIHFPARTRGKPKLSGRILLEALFQVWRIRFQSQR